MSISVNRYGNGGDGNGASVAARARRSSQKCQAFPQGLMLVFEQSARLIARIRFDIRMPPSCVANSAFWRQVKDRG